MLSPPVDQCISVTLVVGTCIVYVSSKTPQGNLYGLSGTATVTKYIKEAESVKQVKLRLSVRGEWEALIGKCSSLIIHYFVF